MEGYTGQQFGNYRLLSLLGRGGFAHVYLGQHLRMETLAAIKLLSTSLADADVSKLLAEARTIARLEHPHIVRILDFDVERDTPFLVMSYAPNGTVRQRYPKGTRLPLATIRTYLQQAADALQYAHDAKLVHRDIKPENMLLGQRNEVLLSDFGVAVIAHSSLSQKTQEIAGTVAYMAPEQVQGRPRPASDQYALAVIVYEWLCGIPPFVGTPAEITSQHMLASPPSLRVQLPHVPPALEAVVLRALEKDPHRRFASVWEFATTFELACQEFQQHASTIATPTKQLLLSSPDLTSPTSGRQPAPQRLSRRAVVLGTAAVLGLAGVGTGAAWLVLPGIQKQPQTNATPRNTLVTYTAHVSPIRAMAWSSDGKRIASGGDLTDRTIRVWDATTGAHPFIYHGHTGSINALAWSSTGQHIASSSGDDFFKTENVIQVWVAATGALVATYRGHRQAILTLAWRPPDNFHIASGSTDKTVQIWEAMTGKPARTYTGHTAAIRGVVWSPGGGRIASGGDDATVQVWDARTMQRIFTLGHHNNVNGVAWSPNGKLIVTACGNILFGGEHNAQVWDATTGKRLLTYSGHSAAVNAVAWSPDSRLVASASYDKTVRVWDGASGRHIFTYHGHTLAVNAVAWSPDGKLIASAGSDGTVRVWRVLDIGNTQPN